MNPTFATEKGRRTYQEDRYVVHNDGSGVLMAILDGHGGEYVSNLVAKELPGLWDLTIPGDYPLLRLQATVKAIVDKTVMYAEGSTLSMVYVPFGELYGGYAYVGVMGDSPIIIGHEDGTQWVAPEHNVRTNQAEREAAEKRGGFVSGGYLCRRWNGQGLQMARALGNSWLYDTLLREAEYFTVPLQKNSFVLLASDGVFDPGHANPEESIARVVTLVRLGQNAADLVADAVAMPTHDNATAILYRVE